MFGYPLSVTHRQIARINMRYLNPKKEEIILDVGCGIGHYVFELATKFDCKVYGVDIDADDIELASRMAENTHTANAVFSVGDILHLEFPDEMFDKVLLSQVIERVRDDENALQELYRILKPGGYLILLTRYVDIMQEYAKQEFKIYKHAKKQLDVEGGRVRNGYSFERLSEILNNAGFEIVDYKYIIKKFTKSMPWYMFLLIYPVSMLDNLLQRRGEYIAIKSKKHFNILGREQELS